MSTSSLLSSATSLTGSQGFTGNSKFANGLQQVLARTLGIRALPLRSLEAGLTTLNDRQSAIRNLDQLFTSLQSAANSLEATLKNNLKTTSISDASVLSATVASTAAAGTFSVEVLNLGAFATAVSASGASPVTDPSTTGITASTSLTLTVGGGSPVTITPASATLSALAEAINASSTAGVQATVVNIGSTASPDYRLSLAAQSLGAGAIQLTGDEGNLISTSTTGALASYKVNSVATPVTSTSRAVTLAPGLTVNLLGQSLAGIAATITVRNDPGVAAASLSSFARAYNSAFDGLAGQRGQSRGALVGDSLVQTLGRILKQLGTFSNATPGQSLAAFGVTVEKAGHLTVDGAALATAANADFSKFLATLGSTTTGGFLKAATDSLNGLEDTTNGSLKLQSSRLTDQIAARKSRIDTELSRLTLVQENLSRRLARADAAIAALESKVSYVNGLFYNITGNNNNPNGNSNSL